MFGKILIVCIGNICRSPMAEALFRHALGVKAQVESAGVAALEGRSADAFAQELLRERGIDIAAHRARQLTPSLITEFDLVVTMDNEQTRAVESILPSARGRVHRLGKWSDFDIPDPHKQPREAFERALDLIDQGVMDWKKKFWT
jgi:protein-tyrosine phosphatase